MISSLFINVYAIDEINDYDDNLHDSYSKDMTINGGSFSWILRLTYVRDYNYYIVLNGLYLRNNNGYTLPSSSFTGYVASTLMISYTDGDETIVPYYESLGTFTLSTLHYAIDESDYLYNKPFNYISTENFLGLSTHPLGGEVKALSVVENNTSSLLSNNIDFLPGIDF